jgi:hypothetical protein
MFTLSFWKNALENSVTAFATAFAGSLAILGVPTQKGIEAAAIAAGLGALTAFLKQLGAVQNAKSVLKVKAEAGS